MKKKYRFNLTEIVYRKDGYSHSFGDVTSNAESPEKAISNLQFNLKQLLNMHRTYKLDVKGKGEFTVSGIKVYFTFNTKLNPKISIYKVDDVDLMTSWRNYEIDIESMNIKFRNSSSSFVKKFIAGRKKKYRICDFLEKYVEDKSELC